MTEFLLGKELDSLLGGLVRKPLSVITPIVELVDQSSTSEEVVAGIDTSI